MIPHPLAALAAQHRSGTLARADFWRLMRDHHLALRGYQELLSGSAIAAIEIEATDIIVRLGSGVRYIWEPEDVRQAPSIIVNHGSYEPIETAAILACAAASEVVFDVGANIGWYAAQIGETARHRGGRVYAFEPVPRTFGLLERNLALNGLGTTVTAVNFGLSDRATEATVFVPAFSGLPAASQRRLHTGEANEEIVCRFQTLDGFHESCGAGRLDFLKCDVEGAELMVLQGGRDTIGRHLPAIFLEMLRKWSAAFGYHPNDIIALLAPLGYRCHALSEAGLAPTEAVTDETIETNFLFLVPGRHDRIADDVSRAIAAVAS